MDLDHETRNLLHAPYKSTCKNRALRVQATAIVLVARNPLHAFPDAVRRGIIPAQEMDAHGNGVTSRIVH
eukprot:4142578-Amphidinium_carterae.1